ncbi:MAG: hypothetical protein JWM93_2280 [Frankiales bacterium]|nr:hypothetical protein [Frankiales bacterium]
MGAAAVIVRGSREGAEMTDQPGGQPPSPEQPWQAPPPSEQPPSTNPPSQPYGQPYGQPHAQPYGQPYGQQQHGQQQHGQPHGQPGYGAPYGQAFPPASGPANGLGRAALICGALGLLLGIIKWTVILGIPLGILGMIFGLVGHGRGRKGLATNGTGALAGAALGTLGAIIGIVWFVGGVRHMAQDPAVGDYAQCLIDANNDQAKMKLCADRFINDVGGDPNPGY